MAQPALQTRIGSALWSEPSRPGSRDVDEQRVEELLVLVRVHFEIVEVVAEALALDRVHPPAEAALEAGALVAAEVEAARALEEAQQHLEPRIPLGLMLDTVVAARERVRIVEAAGPDDRAVEFVEPALQRP